MASKKDENQSLESTGNILFSNERNSDLTKVLLRFLDIRNLGAVSRVNKYLEAVIRATDNSLWQQELASFFPKDRNQLVKLKLPTKKQADMLNAKAGDGLNSEERKLLFAFRLNDQTQIDAYLQNNNLNPNNNNVPADFRNLLLKKDGLGHLPLEYAIKNNNVEVVKKLIALNIYSADDLYKALKIAIANDSNDSLEIIKLLLSVFNDEQKLNVFKSLKDDVSYKIYRVFLETITPEYQQRIIDALNKHAILAQIIEEGDYEAFSYFKDLQLSLTGKDKLHQSFLDVALLNNQFIMAKELINEDSLLTIEIKRILNIVLDYCNVKQTTIFSLNRNTDIHYDDNRNAISYLADTLPAAAFSTPHVELVRFCVEVLKTPMSPELFQKVIKAKNFLTIKYCLELNANLPPDQQLALNQETLNTLLYDAVESHNFDAASYYLDLGAKFDNPNNNNSKTLALIQNAVKNKNYLILSFLIEKKVHYGFSALIDENYLLIKAIERGNLEAIKNFLSVEANPNVGLPDKSKPPLDYVGALLYKGETPLTTALKQKEPSIEIIECLLKHGARNYVHLEEVLPDEPVLLAQKTANPTIIELVTAPSLTLSDEISRELTTFKTELDQEPLKNIQKLLSNKRFPFADLNNLNFSELEEKNLPKTIVYIKRYGEIVRSWRRLEYKHKDLRKSLIKFFQSYSQKSTYFFRHHHDLASEQIIPKLSNAKSLKEVLEILTKHRDELIGNNIGQMKCMLDFTVNCIATKIEQGYEFPNADVELRVMKP